MEKKTVEVQDAQSHLKELLSLVGTGTEVILTEGNTPVARLLPFESSSPPRIAGLHKSSMWDSEDFDKPLPESFWTDDYSAFGLVSPSMVRNARGTQPL